MNLIDQIHRLQRIHQLIRRKATGPPHDFSSRLGISNRQLYRLLDELKSYGLPIEYCRTRQSYYYSREVEFEISFEIRDNNHRKIFGGRKMEKINFDFFHSLTRYGSKRNYLES
ncbi:hypothetical protein KUV50_13735 [Membranicola marinus]|uniref:HTH domain-containing protein n=1 Tax=Membranihabitans marinus TaxID=1227546 RepID=A0A953HQ64_9BACT|nr:hypothetical protein [Membranihabitans marinus]MBY5959209.1 hypothetical protein [Membranihabitans marinus]